MNSLILQILSQFNNKGFQELSTSLENIRADTVKAANATQQLGSSLTNAFRILKGTALALPLAGFIKEAIAGEKAFKQLQAQAQIFGETIDRINYAKVADNVARLGVSETELTNALSRGLPYFRSTQKELALLDTAVGISKIKGIDLASAYTQLGYVQMGYGQRILRTLGVTMDKNIKDPALKGADALAKLTAMYAPLAKGTGSVAEEFKKLSASMSNIGEKIGSEFLAVIGSVAKSFNALSPATQELILRTTVYTSAVIGLTTAFKGLGAVLAFAGGGNVLGAFTAEMGNLLKMSVSFKNLPIMFTSLKTALAGLIVPAAFVAMVASLSNLLMVWNAHKEAVKQLKDVEEQEKKTFVDAMAVKLDGLGKELSLTDELEVVTKELGETRALLGRKYIDEMQQGMTLSAEITKAEIIETNKRIESVKQLAEAKKKLGIETEEKLKEAYEKAILSEYEASLNATKRKYENITKNESLIGEERKKLQAIYEKELETIQDKELQKRAQFQRDLASLNLTLEKSAIEKEFSQRKALTTDLNSTLRAQNKKLMEADLADKRAAAKLEVASLNEELKKSFEYRTALAKRQADEERQIRISYLKAEADATLGYALKTKEEQKAFDTDRAKAQEILNSTTVKGITNLSDAEKEILKTEAGQEVLQAKITAEAEKRATLLADIDKARNADLERRNALEESLGNVQDKQAKGLKELGVSREVIAKFETTTDVNVTITPNVGELALAVAKKVQDEVTKKFADIQTEFNRQLSAGRTV